MTGLEAIPKVSELLVRLNNRVKDHQTTAIIQQIKQLHLAIHQELIKAQARIAELEAENAKLKQPPEANADGAEPSKELSEGELAILKLLSAVGNNRPEAIEIGQRVGLGPERAKFHVSRLADMGLVTGYFAFEKAPTYGLTEAGREYLLSRGHI